MGLLSLFGGGGRGRRGAQPAYTFAVELSGKGYDLTIRNAESLPEARAVLAHGQEAMRAGLAAPAPLALPAPVATAASAPVASPAKAPGHPPVARAKAMVEPKVAAANFDRHLREMGRTGLLSVSELEIAYRDWCRETMARAYPWSVLATELSQLWGPSARRRCGQGKRESFYNVPALAVVSKRRAA